MADTEELNRYFKLAEENQTSWKQQAQEDLNFYLSKQWDSKDIAILEEQKRPHLTFNHIAPLIHLISGYQRQNRQDMKIYNRKGGTQQVAEILTAIAKHINDNSNGDFESSYAFLLGTILARAFLDVTIDYDYDPYNGELKIGNTSPFQVYVDPYSEKYDLSDASFLFKTVWLPKKKIELIYPEKKDELESVQVEDSDRLVVTTESNTYKPSSVSEASNISERDKYKYRVKECWWREYVSETFLYDLNNGVAKKTDLTSEHIKNLLAKYSNLRKIKRVIPKMHLTTYVGNAALQDTIPFEEKGGLRRFTIVPFYAYWVENNFFSVVTNLKDPQREINKRYSQLLHHLNMSANSGWIGDEDAVKDWDELEEMGSRPGITIKKKKGSHLERINPSVLSEGHLILAKEGAGQIKNVSGINPDLLGIAPQENESGIAIQLRQRQGVVALEVLFDNFRITKQLLGKVLIEMIQKSGTYSREEVLKIVVDGEEKEFEINQRNKFLKLLGVERILNDLSVGEYDCVVAQQPSNPTARLANFYALLSAAKAGIPIPPATLIKASDLPDKEEILSAIGEGEKAKSQLAQEELNLKKTELAIKAKQAEIKGQTDLAKIEEE